MEKINAALPPMRTMTNRVMETSKNLPLFLELAAAFPGISFGMSMDPMKNSSV